MDEVKSMASRGGWGWTGDGRVNALVGYERKKRSVLLGGEATGEEKPVTSRREVR